jgi:chromosome segregation ATPase
MSSNLGRAIDDVKRLGKMWSGLLELSTELEKLKNLDDARAERVRALAAITEQVATLEQTRDFALQRNAAINEEGEAAAAEARARAAKIVEEGEAEVKRRLAHADEAVARANQEASKVLAGIEALVEERRTAEVELKNAKEAVTARLAELEEIQGRINRAKATVAQMLR